MNLTESKILLQVFIVLWGENVTVLLFKKLAIWKPGILLIITIYQLWI